MLMLTNNQISREDHTADNRSIVYATDSLDQPDESVETGNASNMSIASTVDVDNTSCYLKRFANQFAQEVEKQGIGVQPIFVRINKFKLGQVVLYTGSSSYDQARIVDVYYESNSVPKYNIELSDGYIEAYVSEDQLERWDETKVLKKRDKFQIHYSPSHLTFVNFDSNPSTHALFSFLFSGEFNEAKNHLSTHPDEASLWVIRYGKSAHETSGGGNNHAPHNAIRWKLLPLHLFILLAGSHDDSYITGNTTKEKPIPSIDLLAMLLTAYPDATKCIDDKHMIPLHSSIHCQSSPCIIKALIKVNPGSVLWKDTKGRDSFVLLNQVVKQQMKRAVINAADEAHAALRIENWKQEVLFLLSKASKHVSVTDSIILKDGEGNHQPDDLRVPPKQTGNVKAAVTSSGSLGAKDKTAVEYLQLHFQSSNEIPATKDITPCSTMTSVTEFTTPTSTENETHQYIDASAQNKLILNWETRCHMLGLESYDSCDKNNENMPFGDNNRGIEISTETQIKDSSSIFRDRMVHLDDAIEGCHFIADNHFDQEVISRSSAKDKATVFDSSLILAAMFSYESEDDVQSTVKSDVFSKDTILPIQATVSNNGSNITKKIG